MPEPNYENVTFQNGVKIEDMILLCRPNGRSMTAATALMGFPFSLQQDTNRTQKML